MCASSTTAESFQNWKFSSLALEQCMCVCAYLSVSVCECMCIHVNVCVCVCVRVRVHVRVRVRLRLRVCVCMHTCTYLWLTPAAPGLLVGSVRRYLHHCSSPDIVEGLVALPSALQWERTASCKNSKKSKQLIISLRKMLKHDVCLVEHICILVYVGFSCTSVCIYKYHSTIYTQHHSTVIFTMESTRVLSPATYLMHS